VVFVDDGTAVAAGTHHDLLRTDPRYRAVVTREPDPAPGPVPAPARAPHTAATMEESA
jgi:hypothetical protein